ncbi:MAG TPA: GNAT family N-acetyltransferase [Actinomycetes bacterium]|nr:GNAT family N-acetyltransferase [Actinomycetes bacterium]
MTASHLERIYQFTKDVTRRQATRHTVLGPGVELLLNDDFPVSHVHNYVLATDGAKPPDVLAGIRQLTSEGRHAHTHLVVDDAGTLAARLEQPLADEGMKRENLEILLWTSDIDRPADPSVTVQEVTGQILDTAVWSDWERDLPQAPPDTIRQLVERRSALEKAVDTTHLAVLDADRVVSRASVYHENGVGQIEDVNTQPDYQGRGYARATVLAGVDLLRGLGCDLIFLEADADDWPRELYFRLGFTHLAPLTTFTGIEPT